MDSQYVTIILCCIVTYCIVSYSITLFYARLRHCRISLKHIALLYFRLRHIALYFVTWCYNTFTNHCIITYYSLLGCIIPFFVVIKFFIL